MIILFILKGFLVVAGLVGIVYFIALQKYKKAFLTLLSVFTILLAIALLEFYLM